MKEEIKPGYVRVSDVASAYANHHKVPKNVLDYAADRGTQVHKIIDYIMNDIPVPEDMYMFSGKSIKGYVDSWEKYRNKMCYGKLLHQEERFDDDILKLTGKPDLVVQGIDRNYIVDWKCTKAAGKHWELQASGYGFLLFKYTPAIVFVRLCQDGEYPEVIEYEPNYELFMKAYELYKRYFEDKTCNLEME